MTHQELTRLRKTANHTPETVKLDTDMNAVGLTCAQAQETLVRSTSARGDKSITKS